MEILGYWAERNGFTKYSGKLDGMFRTALRVIAEHPKLGRPSSDPDVRFKSVGDHMVFYLFIATDVHVLSIWHDKRDPKDRPY